MSSRYFVRTAQWYKAVRWFNRSSIIRESNQVPKKSDSSSVLPGNMHRVSDFDRRILVWVKRYPSMAEVPKDVSMDCILTARNKARIKACNYMIIFAIIGSIVFAMLGKRQAARGEGLIKMREDWFREAMEKDKKAST